MPVSLPFQPRAVGGARGKKKRGAAGSGASESWCGFNPLVIPSAGASESTYAPASGLCL